MERDGLVPETLSEHDMPVGMSSKAAMEACWDDLRRDGGLPRRRDLDPSRMETALPCAFILERVAPGVGRIRVAGQVVASLLGTEARGMTLSGLFTASAQPAVALWLDRCLDRPGIVDLPILSQARAFRAGVSGRLLLLPLLDQNDEPTRVLGGVFLDGPPRRANAPLSLVNEAPARWERIERRPASAAAAVGATSPGRSGAGAGTPRLRLMVDNTR